MKIIENRHEEIIYYEIGLFNEAKVNHLFTSRIGWGENELEKLSKLFNVPKTNIVGLTQVHGTDIISIDKGISGEENVHNLIGDGLVTNMPNLVLITYHADCVPIYFYDRRNKVVGLAHGGWKGTYGNISGKMIDLMVNKYDSKLEDILVGIGPSIGPCCYEIGRDLACNFANRFNDFDGIVEERGNKIYLDLWKINYLQIKDKGVLDDNIAITEACTACHSDKFYSYRKERGTKNRMMAAIGLTSDFGGVI